MEIYHKHVYKLPMKQFYQIQITDNVTKSLRLYLTNYAQK